MRGRNPMTEEMRVLNDACEAAGIAASELAEYRITADSVRLVAKDGRKWVVEIVRLERPEDLRLNPELTSGEAAKAATTKPGRGRRGA